MNKQTIPLSDELKTRDGGLLEALHMAQRMEGYISKASIQQIAQHFGVAYAQVYETASFYSYLHLKPVGRHIIRICESAPCHVAGASEVVEAIESCLNIKMGETTSDNRFTLQFTECVGQCQNSPTITIDLEPHTGVTPEKVDAILSAYQ